ncbi:MAG: hypothetical protein M1822_003698 [Bathelium mastoideum]|nr:MAG: hypothetical protein M1822_003698 [Bathelium mastoideum]
MNTVEVLLSFPPDHFPTQPPSNAAYDREIREYVKKIDRVSASALIKALDEQKLAEHLDPLKHSIAYLYTILAQLQAISPAKSKTFPDELWSKLSIFCTSFDPVQIRYVGTEFCRLLEFLNTIARTYNSPAMPIQLICAAMLRMDPSCATLTSTHLLYIRLCTDARALEEALPILDKPILSFPGTPMKTLEEQPLCAEHLVSNGYITEKSGLSTEVTQDSVYEYYILGAMIYIALRQWRKALTFLEHILVSPTQNVATGQMLEAYRKWVLVALLVEEKVCDRKDMIFHLLKKLLKPMNPVTDLSQPAGLPRGINGEALRRIRSTSKAYDAISEIYKSGNLFRLRAEAEAGQGLWQDDGNTGLIHQVILHFVEVQVINLSKTYVALPLEHIAHHLGETPQAAEKYLNSLVASGQLNATIEPSNASSNNTSPILRFHHGQSSGPLARSEEQLHADLLAQKQRILELADHLKDADTRLSLSKEYVDFAKAKKDKKEQAGDGGAMDLDWSGAGEDEDMMGDLR